MEKELFTWKEFDCGDDYMVFTDITLVKRIGPFSVNTTFKTASIHDSGMLVLANEMSEYRFKLSYRVGREIK